MKPQLIHVRKHKTPLGNKILLVYRGEKHTIKVHIDIRDKDLLIHVSTLEKNVKNVWVHVVFYDKLEIGFVHVQVYDKVLGKEYIREIEREIDLEQYTSLLQGVHSLTYLRVR